jgi:hypothetical protein
MRAREKVDKAIGNVKNTGPQLIRPLVEESMLP